MSVIRLIIVLAVLSEETTLAQSPQVSFTAYALPAAGFGIATGSDGALWFAEYTTYRIGRMTVAGAITEYGPTSGSPSGPLAGPDGALWFGEYNPNLIGRITTAGIITEYAVPCCGQISGLAAGPDGTLWFTQNNRIGRITTAGVVISQYALPSAETRAGAIAAGPDGAMWFSEFIPGPVGSNASGINRIGRITTAGSVTEYALPQSPVLQGVGGMTAGSDGAIWFTEYNAGRIGRISMSGVVTEYDGIGFPASICSGPDGALWFTEASDVDWVRTIGRMTTSGDYTLYSAPVQNINGGAITTGPDGALWLVDAWTLNPFIVRAEISTSAPGPARLTTPLPGTLPASTTVTFTWNAVSGADLYWLDVGNSVAQGDISAGNTSATSKTVSGLPCDGRTLYVQLWTHVAGGWLTPQRYTYTASSSCGPGSAQIATPVPATRLAGSTVTFTWNQVLGADTYWLDVGNSVAQGDISAGSTNATSKTVGGLPCDGRTIYLQLWTHLSGAWQPPQRYTYTAAATCNSGVAQISTPAPGTPLAASTVTFAWNQVLGADMYWLDIGNSVAQGDISAGSTNATSKTVSGLPCDGRTIYVQLWTLVAGAWLIPQRYTYTASTTCN
jgi:streptogramin lyase